MNSWDWSLESASSFSLAFGGNVWDADKRLLYKMSQTDSVEVPNGKRVGQLTRLVLDPGAKQVNPNALLFLATPSCLLARPITSVNQAKLRQLDSRMG